MGVAEKNLVLVFADIVNSIDDGGFINRKTDDFAYFFNQASGFIFQGLVKCLLQISQGSFFVEGIDSEGK